MNAITFKDFKCYYKNKKNYIQVLFDINLEIKEGEFIALVGESGGGKTTLLKACLGIADAFDGELYIGETSIENYDKKDGRMAYVDQSIVLYPNMTVYENIALPLRIMKTPQSEVDQRVKSIAEKIGINMLLTRKPSQLSGGQQQRVAIGRALVKNPSILFLDEPFSNVDPSLRPELCKLLKELHRNLRTTVILATHDLNDAFSLADRIVVLENGKISAVGTPEELRKNPEAVF